MIRNVNNYLGSTPLSLENPVLFLWRSDCGKSVKSAELASFDSPYTGMIGTTTIIKYEYEG